MSATYVLQYLQWQTRRLARILGIAGLAGLALLGLAAAVYLGGILPARHELQSVRQQLAQQEDMQRSQQHSVNVIAHDPAVELAKFHARFPAGASLPAWLEMIEKAALQQHLSLVQGEYKLTAEKQGRVVRYEMLLPVKGEYLQLRQFIASVLQQIPTAALSDISIKRETADARQIDARVGFVLFLKGDSWH